MPQTENRQRLKDIITASDHWYNDSSFLNELNITLNIPEAKLLSSIDEDKQQYKQFLLHLTNFLFMGFFIRMHYILLTITLNNTHSEPSTNKKALEITDILILFEKLNQVSSFNPGQCAKNTANTLIGFILSIILLQNTAYATGYFAGYLRIKIWL
jgi:hypothetical protein